MKLNIAIFMAIAYMGLLFYREMPTMPGFSVGFTAMILFALLVALVIWAIGWAGGKIRLANPGPAAIWTGRIAYWMGWVGAVLTIAGTVFAIATGRKLPSDDPPWEFAMEAVFLSYFQWAIGRGIRYVLGR